MSRSPPPICPTCQIPISIIHIFTNCTIYSNSLFHYNLPPDIKLLLPDTSPHIPNVFRFLQVNNLLNKILHSPALLIFFRLLLSPTNPCRAIMTLVVVAPTQKKVTIAHVNIFLMLSRRLTC
ncbi:hypothetical protein O3M35_002386 [Rhynocoris fuscipes]|uniref:Uncharacterized protein n=1 Tax=Rhynocoris fuscipes TaxID=488301 RepID=A0AAW1CK67_9HEMI